MSTRMVSRGGKTRFYGFLCMVLVFLVVLYVFRETQVELDSARESASSCSHQLESISSQLQVIVELKLKLERSLEDEKSEHLKTKEDLNALILDEKQLRNKQNVDSMNRYNEIERNHEVLRVEEKKMRDELEKLRLNYLKKEKENKQLIQDLNAAISQIQNLKDEKVKLDKGKEKIETDENRKNVQKSDELLGLKFIPKSSDINAIKSSSVTPAINPQAIDEVTAKSSTPMRISKVTNESQQIENDEVNPINQPGMEISSVHLLNNAFNSQNETSPTQESQVDGNESMKAMPAPPQEERVQKEQLNNNEEDKFKKKNNEYKDDYDQNHFKEDGEIDKDDEDINDFDTREENQPMRYAR